jgi:hypothetical protein
VLPETTPIQEKDKVHRTTKGNNKLIVYCIKSYGNRRYSNLVALYSGIFITPNDVMQERERLNLDGELMRCNSLLEIPSDFTAWIIFDSRDIIFTECPTSYRTRHFFNNSNTNEDTATKFEQHML